MSQTIPSQLPSGQSATVSSSGSSRRPAMTTRAPSDATSTAVARPIPDPPPVTTITWPASRSGRKISDGIGGRLPAGPICRFGGSMEATTATRTGSFVERRFRVAERGSSLRVELLGGLSTFLTMCYILFVNPAILSAAGVPFKGVAVATALAACVTTAAMALLTNYPFALATGLGLNAVVAFDIILGRKVPWPVGMSCIVLEGLLALLLVLLGLRQAVMRAFPLSMKLAIGVGIGLFITLVGLREGGIVVNSDATGIALGDLTKGPPLIALGGILVAAVLGARNVRGSILFGVLSSTALGLIFGVLDGPSGVAEWPSSSSFST